VKNIGHNVSTFGRYTTSSTLTTSKQSISTAVRFLFLNVTPLIQLNIVFSALSNLLISFIFIAQVSLPYIKNTLKTGFVDFALQTQGGHSLMRQIDASSLNLPKYTSLMFLTPLAPPLLQPTQNLSSVSSIKTPNIFTPNTLRTVIDGEIHILLHACYTTTYLMYPLNTESTFN